AKYAVPFRPNVHVGSAPNRSSSSVTTGAHVAPLSNDAYTPVSISFVGDRPIIEQAMRRFGSPGPAARRTSMWWRSGRARLTRTLGPTVMVGEVGAAPSTTDTERATPGFVRNLMCCLLVRTAA